MPTTTSTGQVHPNNSTMYHILPENNTNEGFVHRNINITGNRFQLIGGDAVYAKSVDGLQIRNNLFMTPSPLKIEELIRTDQCRNVVEENNIIEPGN